MKTRKNWSLAGLCLLVAILHLCTVLTGTEYYLTQLTMPAYYGLAIIGPGTVELWVEAVRKDAHI